MKRILIIGDSWGVPITTPAHGMPPEYHLEFLLRSKGYEVLNYAQAGVGNLHSLNYAKRIPSSLAGIDLLIWFQTDFFRDLTSDQILGCKLQSTLYKIAEETYSEVSKFVSRLRCRTVVVGGQCPVLVESLTKYFKPELLIEDWKSEILGEKLTPYFYISNVDWVNNSSEDLDTKTKLLEIHEYILSKTRNSPHFPDDAHPGSEPHSRLADRIDFLICSLSGTQKVVS